MNRRLFLQSALAATLAPTACRRITAGTDVSGNPRLDARPGSGPFPNVALGSQPLGIGVGGRDGILYIPEGYLSTAPAPLLLLLHGATGRATNWFGSYGDRADANGFITLAVDSRDFTWDAIHGSFGADVVFLDAALASVFSRVAVDRDRIAIAGFSDGATYAITLGLANGDLFSRIVAYSPGYLAESERVGRPRIFVSHGTLDSVLPITRASRSIVPRLRDAGYDVTYQEFDGAHEVPAAISDQAMTWLRTSWG
jgi:phospholipase/carboxylesterase